MAFVRDPKRLGVIDPEKGYALWPFVRDVPKDERWFKFRFEDREFIAQAKYSWPEVAVEGQRVLFVFQIKRLEHNFRYSPSHREPRYEPSPQEFRASVLPALSDAVVAMIRRMHSSQPNLTVDVQFID